MAAWGVDSFSPSNERSAIIACGKRDWEIKNIVPALGVRAHQIQAVTPVQDGYRITFNSIEVKEKFIQNGPVKVYGKTYETLDAENAATKIVVKFVPPELPDSAFLVRFQKFGHIVTYNRDFHRGTEIENGRRILRMRLREPIPSFIHIGVCTLSVSYLDQPRTCRRCDSEEHFGDKCDEKRCYNCLRFGHLARDCINEKACDFCLAPNHAWDTCPFLNLSLAEALTYVRGDIEREELVDDNLTDEKLFGGEITEDEIDDEGEGANVETTKTSSVSVQHPAGFVQACSGREPASYASITTGVPPLRVQTSPTPVVTSQQKRPPKPSCSDEDTAKKKDKKGVKKGGKRS